mmetsp:Transcript_2626/g.5685  ORF Transcript_2626/g.5685 Transcript_2626/m.5685 type:complete len:337 (+) Transcript_2626:223-1233(+)|eukprot:CAMPEP_0168178146 /NCGR_PEP_ID=MMETSP0139_2-20121125/8920_1 /TAXON_ID=44445 /ORGANISM="Pseudo-nitzschia australis, Strain 10249 10 AB" /LENGTH=336 /DNA_ID=CAMNT_0008097421 /DNA_START=108 /DNA_END=1118 /DNA_ORIENTATION=-
MGGNRDENPIWSALAEPLSSLIGGQPQDNKDDDSRKDAATIERHEEAYRKRYRKRIQSLQTEVEEVNEEATKTRKQLWETQDKLKSAEDQIRKLENHLNEVLELREKDLESVKTLRAANSDCVEAENKAREAMDVFKKCYKRGQLKIKENEEEIAVLREQRANAEQLHKKAENIATIDESALEHIKKISNEKQKKLQTMLLQTENEVDLWKSKYKVACKRCENWQEQILAMSHPTEATVHIEKQRIKIEELEGMLKNAEDKEEKQREEREREEHVIKDEGEERDDDHYDIRYYPTYADDNVVNRAFCDEDLHTSLTKDLLDRIQKLNWALPTMPKM